MTLPHLTTVDTQGDFLTLIVKMEEIFTIDFKTDNTKEILKKIFDELEDNFSNNIICERTVRRFVIKIKTKPNQNEITDTKIK